MTTTIKTINIFLLSLTLILLFPLQSMAFIVVLDAGHGGKDPGALGTYSKEKNINLNVVLRLGKLIKENCRDVTVIYTRQTDKFVELFERANIANNAKADLFISVHTNSTSGNNTLGTETYSLTLDKAATNMEVVKRENSVIQYENNQQRYSANSLESKIMSEVIMSNNMRTSALFAKSLQDEYRKIGRPNRGVHQQNFHVLRQVAMPSILTELGFISTPSEEAYLNSEQGINELATAIFNAFRKHISPILRGIEEQPVVVNTPPVVNNPQPETTETEDTPQQNSPRQKETINNASPTKPTEQHSEISSQTNLKPKSNNEKYQFKVQICTSDRQLHSNSEQFKGLKGVESYPVTTQNGKRQFIHTYGNSESYAEIAAIKNKLRQKFSDCFVVVFKGDKKVTGEEAASAFKKQP